MNIKMNYLVISVKEINRLARAARRNQKANKANTTHTISLYLSSVPDHAVDGMEQLSSTSMSDSITGVEQDAIRRESLDILIAKQ